MARRPIEPPRKPGFAPMSVQRVSVDAVHLITVGPDHPVWKDGQCRVNAPGAIVRVQPPATADAGLVEDVVRRLSGAAAVKVSPPAAGERVLVEQAPSEEASLGTREVVYHMVAEARTKNRDLLVDAVEEALCAAKL